MGREIETRIAIVLAALILLSLPETIEDYQLPRSEWERLCREWVFDERARKIFRRHALDGVTYERIAEEMDISAAQTKRIYRRAWNTVKNKI